MRRICFASSNDGIVFGLYIGGREFVRGVVCCNFFAWGGSGNIELDLKGGVLAVSVARGWWQ